MPTQNQPLSRQQLARSIFALALSVAMLAVITCGCRPSKKPGGGEKSTMATLPSDLTYVGRDKCIECHEAEYDLWHGSDHDRSMDHATDETVLADFNDAEFTHIGFDDILKLTDDDVKTLLGEAMDREQGMRQLAIAVLQCKDGVLDKLVRNMTPEQKTKFEDEQANVGIQRPCDISWAHQETDELMRRLVDENRITLNFEFNHARFYRRDGKFICETDGPDGSTEAFEVKYVFGVRPLQQYLVEFEDGRVQCLPTAWDTENKRWYHLYTQEQIPYDDPLHWTRPLQNWNYMCAECHSTNLQKNYDLATNTYHTSWSEINVSCETCHGPGSLHVALAEQVGADADDAERARGKEKSSYWNPEAGASTVWDKNYGLGLPGLKSAESKQVIESCVPCHARRRVVHPGPKPPESDFLDYYVPELIDDDLYYADGQILEEDYVYTSFLQSRMFHEQVRCTDCHDPHSVKVKFNDNRLCCQCHVAAKYDTISHHHHPDPPEPTTTELGSPKSGTLCVDCHMPETTYMVVDPRRDHSIRIPRPDLTISLGIPNACTTCHNDVRDGETPEWAEQWCRTWYDDPQKDTRKDNEPKHFAYGIAGGRHAQPAAIDSLLDTARMMDGKQIRPLVRASAVALLGNYPDDSRAESQRFASLEDENGLVREAAVHSMQQSLNAAAEAALPHLVSGRSGYRVPAVDELYRLVDQVTPLLHDEVRAVRIEAARLLSVVPGELLSPKQHEEFLAALDEYVESQRAVEDQAGAHLNLGVVYANLARPALERAAMQQQSAHQTPEAQAAYLATVRKLTQKTYDRYQNAVRVDPLFLPVRFNLAMLCNQRGENAEAEKHLRAAIAMDDSVSETHYMLGLLLAEDPERLAEAAEALGRSVQLEPDNARARYNYALALQGLERYDDAEAQLQRTLMNAPNNVDYMNALAILYSQQEKWDDALRTVRRMQVMAPGNPQFVATEAQFLAQQQRWKEAADAARRLLLMVPNDPSLQQMLQYFELQATKQDKSDNNHPGEEPQ